MLYAAKSHTGLVRQMNQDSYAVHPMGNWTFAVVADGMGGAAAGEIASQMAAEVVVREVELGLAAGTEPIPTLRQAIQKANHEIWAKSRSNVDYLGMGTTLVAALYTSEEVIVAHVGDSRAYRFHAGVLEQVTRDHSLVAELVRRGQITEDEAMHHPQKNVVTRSLGTLEWSDPEIYELTFEPGDLVLLCTDGLTNCVTGEELTEHLATIPSDTQEAGQSELEGVCDQLVQLTLDRGAPDNITLILIAHRKELGAK
ncbi:Stp1/IreP family PP2C-type Ser/Thr phosphatase [Alicyclobacillus mengziensis]|uniref:Stp1/IreP family PP2C-type Ser/Thr phosphatase n=1 Tax=Alicyclobacillus mengziensis TaxID=2931921 RepID=A0A9X7W2X1_9BACL|nr:Stp1/IreP family PP2C-type Ser/Thr phosphatase [Alicyclobacillus mengziensis]QSO49507.1 Stp1/IreP family PP2C-type Ser/Thr phosphatase [Alicyclobacillus mengziensis]